MGILKYHFAAMLFLLLPLAVYAAEPEAVGEIVYLKGDVSVGHAQRWQAAENGMSLFVGQHIRTGASSRVRVQFSDGTSMQMGQHAEAVIERYKVEKDDGIIDALLNLLQGRARFMVEKLKRSDSHYQVRMRTVLIGVRGTDILAQADARQAHVALVEGRVALTQPGAGNMAVILERGAYVRVDQAWPVRPVAIPGDWLDAFIRDVGLSSEGSHQKKRSGDDDAPPASVIQQKSIDQLGLPTIVPR